MNRKIEDNIIKTYFDERKIQPSDKSWDRLDAMLAVSEKKEESRILPVWWLRTAAAIFILAVSAILFFNNVDHVEENNVVHLDNPAVKSEELPTNISAGQNDEVSDAETNSGKFTEVIKTPVTGSRSVEIVKINSELHVSGKNSENKIVSEVANSDMVVVEVDENLKKSSSENELHQSDLKSRKPTLNIDAATLLASIDSKQTSDVSVAENKSINRKALNIDANKLLADAEDDAAKGFMNKVFKTLHETSTNVLTSVNNRNHIKQ
jgi:hypothetical protein